MQTNKIEEYKNLGKSLMKNNIVMVSNSRHVVGSAVKLISYMEHSSVDEQVLDITLARLLDTVLVRLLDIRHHTDNTPRHHIGKTPRH